MKNTFKALMQQEELRKKISWKVHELSRQEMIRQAIKVERDEQEEPKDSSEGEQ